MLDPKITLQYALAEAQDALCRIATPARPDGTYNNSREACEMIAHRALQKIAEILQGTGSDATATGPGSWVQICDTLLADMEKQS